MLAGLYDVGRMEPVEAGAAVEAAGSSAKRQLRLFMYGVLSYAVWVLAHLIL